MSRDILQQIEARNADKERSIGAFDIGDTVDVKVKISEGDKSRIQNFTGTVIARQHGGLRESFTVRRLVDGEGVERTFPLHSPHVVGVEVKRKGVVRRAKLYFLRDRVGKATRLREKRVAVEEVVAAGDGAAAKKGGRKRGAKAKAERKARAAAEGAGKAAKKGKKQKAAAE
ncbi:MAG: 50S ribosomal protein L19 [Planctomycetes bacterium]|nr:50S ribosomal protein L19 [Planctomycetota bacterium]